MRWVTVQTEEGPRACGVWQGQYVDVNAANPEFPADIRSLLALGHEWQRRAWGALAHGHVRHDPEYATLLAPVPDPRKIVCLGLNYRDHAAESGMEPPGEPVLFSKYPTALIGHLGEIVLPEVSTEVDFEAELVIVVGSGGRHIPREHAMRHVAGYTIGHDVSARDWQLNKPGKQWMAGKTFDTFAPVGPALVTLDEIPDPHSLGIRLRLNGKTMQESNTSQFIFKVDEVDLLSLADLHAGAGRPDLHRHASRRRHGRKPPVWLQPGDVAEVEIDHLGILRNTVVRH